MYGDNPGRQPFTQPGGDMNERPVKTQGSEAIKTVTNYAQTSLSSGSTETITLDPPSGKVWSINSLQLRCPDNPDATTGTHQFWVEDAGEVEALLGESNYNSYLRYQSGYWAVADVRQQPDTSAAQVQATHQLQSTVDNPINIHYQNGTDTAQSETRYIGVVVHESDAR